MRASFKDYETVAKYCGSYAPDNTCNSMKNSYSDSYKNNYSSEYKNSYSNAYGADEYDNRNPYTNSLNNFKTKNSYDSCGSCCDKSCMNCTHFSKNGEYCKLDLYDKIAREHL